MSETQRTTSTVSRLFVLVSVRICLIVVSTCLQRNRAAIQSCPASLESIKDDVRCPTNLTEWNKKAQEMQCASFSQNCTEASDFVYHCLVNAWGNGTIHVCAPTRIVFGRLCAEFSKGGARIQEHYVVQCTACPFHYKSTKSYLYQECYENIKTTTPRGLDSSSAISQGKDLSTAREKNEGFETGNVRENFLLVAVPVAVIISIVLSFVVFAIVLRKRRRESGTHTCIARIPLFMRNSDQKLPVIRPNSDTCLELKSDFLEILCKVVDSENEGTEVLKRKIYESEFHEKYANYCLKPNIEPMNITGNWREDLGIQTAADLFNMKIYVHVQLESDETKIFCFLPKNSDTDEWMKIALEKEKRYKHLADHLSTNEEDAPLTYDDVFDLSQFAKDKAELEEDVPESALQTDINNSCIDIMIITEDSNSRNADEVLYPGSSHDIC